MNLRNVSAPAYLAALLVMSGCSSPEAEPRWVVESSDVGFAIEAVAEEELLSDSFRDLQGCEFKELADATLFALRSDEAVTAEYLGEDHRILVEVRPYRPGYHSETFDAPPGRPMAGVRSGLQFCENVLESPEGDRLFEFDATEFRIEGDASDAAMEAQKDPSLPSNPVGWYEHYADFDDYLALRNLDKPKYYAFDGMEQRYAQGYYDIVEDAYVAVYVVSSVEPKISAEKLMDVMREKLAADPPESRYDHSAQANE